MVSVNLKNEREARGRLSCHHLKKSFLFAPSKAAFIQKALFETASLIRMGCSPAPYVTARISVLAEDGNI